jgi:peptide-methionine (S)-S-oxide reductase
MSLFGRKPDMPTADTALPGHDQAVPVRGRHTVLDTPTVGPWPDGYATAVFGMGCFWGIERLFWQLPGVHSTAAGYAGGFTENPSYEEVCSGRTGHTEVVQVVYDPARTSFADLLVAFWENHDPTQLNRQHNDVGTQYRSAIYTTTPEQLTQAQASRDAYQVQLRTAGLGQVTTEIAPLTAFYYAEDYHQQYLQKVPYGYCSMAGTGVACSVGTGVNAPAAH